MKITFKESTKALLKVKDLHRGDTFILSDELGEKDKDVFIVTDIYDVKKSTQNAIRLDTGQSYDFKLSSTIVKVNCELSVEVVK